MPLNPVARAAIEELRGRGVTDLTPDEVVEINDIGEAQMRAGEVKGMVFETEPCSVGSLTLYPLTCCASDFINDWLTAMPNSISADFVYFTLAHAREAVLFDNLTNIRDIIKAVKKWRRSISQTRKEIDECAAVVVGGNKLDDLTLTKSQILQVADMIETIDPKLSEAIRNRGATYLDLCKAEGETRTDPTNKAFRKQWRRLAEDLSMLTGTSVDYWYKMERLEFISAYQRAIRAKVEMTALGLGAKTAQKTPDEIVKCIAKMRSLIARICKLRENRKGAENG